MSLLEAIADPARLRIVRYLAARGRASLPELADAAGVHVNTARPHVLRLHKAGLLKRSRRSAAGRGRPPADYWLTDRWGLSVTDYLGLAELLGAVLVRGARELNDLRNLGREWGRYLAGRPGIRTAESTVVRALECIGFLVRLDDTLQLEGCPCPLVAPDRPQLVCELAVGVAEGALAGVGSNLRVFERRHDPERRRCGLAFAPAGHRPLGAAASDYVDPQPVTI